ncbi:hypothetical protein CWR43_15125 [Rhizobium sullae]|uniref:Uncharacterized protein n=1 Tax=Rhizobium sullae TaxID=50338 RepID=A0A2N0D9J2_RHISU|nr:hypothetical protein [Rhizobium sullae]PKA42754.1 hypothetical protein CWR43_15125 [Rhizobium sullae]
MVLVADDLKRKRAEILIQIEELRKADCRARAAAGCVRYRHPTSRNALSNAPASSRELYFMHLLCMNIFIVRKVIYINGLLDKFYAIKGLS